MIGQSNIKRALQVDIAISAPMADALQTWSLMYENKASWLSSDIKSLNLPAAIAGEIARATTIEMKVEVSGSPRAIFLQTQFEAVLDKLREKVEVGCAKGGLMIKPYVDGSGLAVDFVQADQFLPVEFDTNGNITACIFVDQRHMGNYWYTRLEYHQMTSEGYAVTNQAYRSTAVDQLGQAVSLDSVDTWASIQSEALITGIDKPLYAYFKFPLANNIDPTSPLGVSCYSRAVDLIQEADIQWSNLLWEFESGQRALYVDVLAFDKDSETGKPILPQKRLYRALNGSGNIKDEDMFHEWTPTLREVNILTGLDAILKRIEYTCGLAYGTLSDPQTVDKTATEIKISKQRTYATITDTQKALQKTLDQLIWAMDVYATIYQLAPRGVYTTTYAFDDSVVTDKELQMAQDRQTVSMGAMPKWMFLVRNYGLDEATAKVWIANTQAEQPADLFAGAAQ